ncbi:dnaJ homolog subfamily C member 17-like isoform X2 [Mya arenaria]|uniref:dnaJ homolog subfamily C member 17-like isoform X2 n=1 Tax=Mya arenaria TaxID=6604 RepID=UPI0022E6B1AA|nr:dnaJ homolog subfamily C member 17-like isoform X2 [Mya arenaria]
MANKLDMTKEDLYGILGVEQEATEKHITKAYRKQALKCHPDKNPDNPKAAEKFHKLTQALEILVDAAARAAYDKILKGKKEAEWRRKQYDSKRKKFKDDLEVREKATFEKKEDAVDAAKRLQQEIERLRKEGNSILRETQEQLRRDLEERQNSAAGGDSDEDLEGEEHTAKIKAKWKIKKGNVRDEGYTRQELDEMFSKFGNVLNIVVSVKKSGTAIIEFSSPYTADVAMKNVSGKPDFPLTLSWLSGQQPEDRLGNHGNSDSTETRKATGTSGAASFPTGATSFTSFSQTQPTPDNRDFESVVLMKMRQAEERKRLIEQMMKEDEEG